jgi:hypothetical protein
MIEHPKRVGDRATLAIMLALEGRGFRVYLPFTENTRCDLITDDGSRLGRVQCKSGRLRHGAIRFNACSSYAHHPNPKIAKRDYRGEVDYFAVYCPETSGVYLIPIEDMPVKRQGALRVDPPKNRQRRLIRLASDYELGRIQISEVREGNSAHTLATPALANPSSEA